MLKITQSLISSWDRAFSARDEAREDCWKDFLDTLHRVPRPETDAQRDGKIFEAGVYAMADGKPYSLPPNMEQGARKVAQIVKGGSFQLPLSRAFKIGEHDVTLVGVPDVVKAGVIYDVKYRTKGFGSGDVTGKWLGASQHSAYFFLMPEAYEFNYLCSDGIDLYTERYIPRSVMPFEQIAAEFIGSLISIGLFDDYKRYWRLL